MRYPGIDPVALGRAVWHNVRSGGGSQGGSTITQQLARTLYLSNSRTYGRKAKEAALALMLEVFLTKREILELYFNRVYLSGGVYGVDGNMRTADVFIDPVHSGTPACLDRQWRTILIGTYREGGPGFFVIDITQPDTINSATNVPSAMSTYVASCADGQSGCSSVFPAKLWEFYDLSATSPFPPSDDDANGSPDLGESWSLPVVRFPSNSALHSTSLPMGHMHAIL